MEKFNKLEIVTLLFYRALRQLIDRNGKEKLLMNLKSVRPSLDIMRFNNPEYKNIADRELAWALSKDFAELNEDYSSIRDIDRLKKYEEDNKVDLYKVDLREV